jgi:4-hydroxyphenylacetate 3-monooxygenase
MSQRPEDILAGKNRPFTGAEYLESLRDGREVYIYGELVKDVTTHPAFRNSAASTALLYDALHDEKHKAVLTAPTDTGSSGFTHKYFKVARSKEDVIGQRDAIADWARITYGWSGRSPDYKAAFLNTLGANADFYGKFADNARAWHKRSQEAVLYLNHALVNPPIDRNKPAEQVKDVYITIQKETDAGIYVSGAKVVATNSALTHYNFLGQNMGQEINDPAMVVMFIAPMDTPGIKLICRQSYEFSAAATGSPWDYPLTSRFDENDAIFVFDNAFIPWENVFIHRDIERLKNFYPRSGFFNGFTMQGCTRLAVKLDFIAGLLFKAARVTGVESFRGVQAQIGEVIGWRNLFWSLTDAMAMNPEPWVNGAVLPNGQVSSTYRLFMLERHRLQGAHQDHEASMGRDRHRVRRPPRALRNELFRQPRAGAHLSVAAGAVQRPAQADGSPGRQMHGRLRRERLDTPGLQKRRRHPGGREILLIAMATSA